jgi:hypothetical protein
MRSSHVSVIAVSAVAFMLAGTLAGSASARLPDPVDVNRGEAAKAVALDRSGTNCYQSGPPGRGDFIAVHHHEPEYAQYNTRGAADFTLGRRCLVTSVEVAGDRTGRANSITIWIRENASGLPGELKCTATTAGPGPNFTVPVAGCQLRKERTYWLVVEVDIHRGTEGHSWYWWFTEYRSGLDDLWKNPGDGYETGCTEWTSFYDCSGDYPRDYVFAIHKG